MDYSFLTSDLNGRYKRQTPLIAALLFVFSLGFYLYTLQPSLAWGDGTKLQVEASTGESFILAELPDEWFQGDSLPFAKLGVAAWDHPFYVMVGHTLVSLFPNIHPPRLINTISAFFGAGAIAVLFLLCLSYTQTRAAALLAAVAMAVSHTFWFHAVTPEVYTLFAFLLLSSVYLYDRFEKTGLYCSLFFSLFALGLGAATHLLTFLALPAVLFYRIFARDLRPVRTIRPLKLLGLALAFLLGFSPYLVQFIRMLRVFSVGEVLGPVIGSVFLQELLSMTSALFLDSLLAYLMFLVFQFNPIALLIGGYGLMRGWQVSGTPWLKVLAFYGFYTLFGIIYLVTDQFAFFLSSHLFFGILIAFGLARLMRPFQDTKRAGLVVLLGLMNLSMPFLYDLAPRTAPVMGISDETLGIPQIGTGTRDGFAYYVNPNKRGDKGAYLFGKDFFTGAPQNALIIAEWYTDTDEFFVLGYFSTVEGLRPDIEIIGWPMENPFYFDADLAVRLIEEQVERRPVYLASLSEAFYGASSLMDKYCIVPELNLYRVYPMEATTQLPPESACLASPGS